MHLWEGKCSHTVLLLHYSLNNPKKILALIKLVCLVIGLDWMSNQWFDCSIRLRRVSHLGEGTRCFSVASSAFHRITRIPKKLKRCVLMHQSYVYIPTRIINSWIRIVLIIVEYIHDGEDRHFLHALLNHI